MEARGNVEGGVKVQACGRLEGLAWSRLVGVFAQMGKSGREGIWIGQWKNKESGGVMKEARGRNEEEVRKRRRELQQKWIAADFRWL